MSENIKRAKYRVKNAEGNYDVVYLETSMDQVEGLDATVSEINAEVAKKANDSDVAAGFQSVGAEIDAVEAVAAGLDTRLTQAEGDIAKEISDREAAITGVQGEVSKVAGDLAKEVTRATDAEKALGERVTTLEGQVGTDLDELRETVAGNTAAIAQEVADRKGEITRVEGLVAAEKLRAENAEAGLKDAIDTKVSQEIFDAEQVRVNAELDKKAGKIQVAVDIAAAVKVEEERALAAEGVLQTNIDGVSADLSAEATRAKGEEARIEGLAKVAQDEVDALELAVGGIEGRVATNEEEIAGLKAAVSDKGSNTKVFANMEEFNAAELTPKVGDLAFVLDIKKAFIYKGDEAQGLELPTPPKGWVYFDEISTEIDLVNYAKKSEVEAIKAELEKAISDENERAIAAETALSTAIETEVSNREEAVAGVNTGLNDLSNKVSNNVLVVGTQEPTNTDAGHVWLDIN